MSDTTQDKSFSIFGKDVWVYILKASMTGIFLTIATYGTQLLTEVGDSTKSAAMRSQASVKIKHYEELKEQALSDKSLVLLNAFNDKHKLKYELAINDKEVAKKAISQSEENLKMVGSFMKTLLISSSFGLLISGTALGWKSREFNKNKSTFILKNTEISLVRDALTKEVKTVRNNSKVSNKHVIRHEALLDKLPNRNECNI